MANRFLSNIRINDAYTFPASDGTNGQVIKTDGSGNLTFGQLSADSASVMYKDTFTGDGSTTGFTLSNALNDEVQSNIYIDGVYQSKSTYSVSGTAITFSTAPLSGHEIEVISTTGINSGPTAIFTDTFTANGSTTAFTLGQTVHSENQTIVFLNGVYQFKGTYTLSGTTLTLDTAPANGVSIEVMSIGSAYSGGDILYDHDFTSAGLMTSNGSGVYSITANNSANWNTAYGWGDHSTQSYATQSYVGTQISNLVDSSPTTLDTLNELAAALGDDPNFATATATSIGLKAPKASPSFTGNATFGGTVTINNNTPLIVNGNDPLISFQNSAINHWQVGLENTNSDRFVFYDNNAAAYQLILESTSGNATFRGTVTGTSFSAPSGFINGSNGGIRIHSSGTKFFNITAANAARDNIMDIGAPDARFKNLYLGGSITAGGGATFGGDVIITTGKELIIGSQTAAESPLGITIRDNKGDVPVGLVIHNENTGTSADAQIAFETQGAMDFSIGLDRSNSNKFVMSRAGVLGTNNVFTIDGAEATFTGTVQTTQITATNGLNYLKRNTDASLQLRSENTRSGLFITKPATDTVMGSALVLADESYRLGTSNYYHIYMFQNGNTYFNQKVGIGTPSPNALLTVSGSAVQNSNNAGMEVSNSHNSQTVLLINNTTSRKYEIAVGGSANSVGNGSFYVYDGTAGATRMAIDSSGQVQVRNQGNTGADLLLYNTDGSIGSNQMIGRLGFYKSDASGAGAGVSSSIQVRSDSSIGAKSYMSFHTDGGSGQQEAERMRITSGGELLKNLTSAVGIGPSSLADFNSTEIGNGYINLARDDTADAKQIVFGKNGARHSFIETTTSGLTFHYGTTAVANLRDNLDGAIWSSETVGRSIGMCSGTNYASGANHAFVKFEGGSGANIVMVSSSFGVQLTKNSTSWSSNSDERLKENITVIDNVLNKIQNYRCVEYNFINDEDEDKKIGFIAQDWQGDFPAIVDNNKDNMLTMKYTETIPILLKAIQELKADNDSLKARIETLENN
jgi:hypothetical protein